MNYGAFIKKTRKDLNETQGVFAKRLELTQTFLSTLEKDKRKPSLRTLEKLAEIANIPMSKLFMSVEMQELSENVTSDTV